MRRSRISRALSLLLALPAAAVAGGAEPSGAPWLRREVAVALDHDTPELGTLALTVELAEPFDPARPTLLLVEDGQQFRLQREGATAWFRDQRLGLSGGAFNVVGVVGRGFHPALAARLRGAGGEVDWRFAHRLLRSRQWVEDLDAVRRALVGETGRVLLYGASGGGYLVHEYLAVHGDRVLRAVTEAAPVRPLDGWLGLFDDPFWNQLVADDGPRARALAGALDASGRRTELVRLLQRQHYFVGPGELAAERRAAVDEILAGDAAAIARRLEAYQVGAIDELARSDAGIAIAVRMYEFCAPVLRDGALDPARVHPNLENEAALARPLLELLRAGHIPAVEFDRRALHRVDAEVLVVAARHDPTADYRAQIALASHYSRGELFLADDSHTLAALEASGERRRLLASFLVHGLDATPTRALLAALEPRRWREVGAAAPLTRRGS